jgi:hypothetical protein
MNERPSVIERAFQVAKSGKVSNIGQVRSQLAKEGYPNVAATLAGRSLSQQISRMITEATIAQN